MSEIKKDCRYYKGYKPCRWNKTSNAQCSDCGHYSPYREKVLIVKLGAIGDVLRTTCIIPKIKERFPDSYLTWVTKSESMELLSTNRFVDEIWNYDDQETIARLQIQQWEYVYNLDNDHASSALATMAHAVHRIGFVLSGGGVITPTNEAAANWLLMASFDGEKQKNSRTYQEILYEICDFPTPVSRPLLSIPDVFRRRADAIIAEKFNGAGPATSILIGINTGSGSRWPLKMMDWRKIADLIREILTLDNGSRVLLLGGPNEVEKNKMIIGAVKSAAVADAGCDHSLLQFGAIIGRCDALVCGDTLALHVAAALGVRTLVCFGPTSHAEIFDHDGLVQKIIPTGVSCLCCYNSSCEREVSCMDSISLDEIITKVMSLRG